MNQRRLPILLLLYCSRFDCPRILDHKTVGRIDAWTFFSHRTSVTLAPTFRAIRHVIVRLVSWRMVGSWPATSYASWRPCGPRTTLFQLSPCCVNATLARLPSYSAAARLLGRGDNSGQVRLSKRAADWARGRGNSGSLRGAGVGSEAAANREG